MMKKNLLRYLFALFVVAFTACSDSDKTIEPDPEPTPPPGEEGIVLPKRDMRAAWFTTVWELDWPLGDYSVEGQKKKYINYLETMVDHNFNAIFVQVRSMGDAFYDSPYEPWSKVLTGVAGKNPGYDVLAFMLEEAHNRGLEFHAWINPYRINTKTATGTYPPLDAKINKNWVKEYSTIRMYNPALPEVQAHIVQVVKDIVTKYDVDGIAFDDYFYPEGLSGAFDDAAEYQKYGNNFSTIEDFRRANVNNVIKGVQEAIIKVRPSAVFSVSPQADINKNYTSLYADVKTWIKEGWIDIVTPQLYFATGSASGSFNNYLAQWVADAGKTPLMVAYPLYKFGDPQYGTAFQTSQELRNQFAFGQNNSKVAGGVMYSAKPLHTNPVGVMSVFKDVYKDPAIRPFAGRKTMAEPTKPANVKISSNMLAWTVVEGMQYAIYQYKGEKMAAKLLYITDTGSYKLSEKGKYFVSAVNKDNVESKVSDMLTY